MNRFQMGKSFSRRDFLKISGLSLLALGFDSFKSIDPTLLSEDPPTRIKELTGRVTKRSIDVYNEPHLKSQKIQKVARDTLLHLNEEILSPYGPAENPRWYRLENGYVHSAYIQRINKTSL